MVGFFVAPPRSLMVESCECTPAYVTGDRSASITVTTDGALLNLGAAVNLVDGSQTQNSSDSVTLLTQAVAGHWIKFEFAAPVKITEMKWYGEGAVNNQGVWQWSGSNDDAAYTDIGSPETLRDTSGGTGTIHTAMSGNTQGYTFYKMTGTSGNANQNNWQQEIEFKQCACP